MVDSCTRVLVVDDEKVIAWTTKAILEAQGYQAALAYDGMEAMDVARSFRPEFLLTDVIMPRLNGIESAIEIKKFLPKCKVLLFSGNASTADLLTKARDNGMEFDLVVKPIDPEELLARIKAIIASSAA